MSKHRQQRPTIQYKWWTRYLIRVATLLLINATRNNKHNKTTHNRTKEKRKQK